MKKINDMMNELGITKGEQKKYSNEDRQKLLDIDDSTAKKIRNMKFERTNYDESDYGETHYDVIPMDMLTGINRQDEIGDWLELLFKLHKKINFELYISRDNFISYVKNLNEERDDLPHVLHIDDGYVVNGNGKHRLTIAKCIGVEQFPVLVTTLKKPNT